jgi:hypothetical protein
MASSTRKWLVGCGIGCGGAIVLSIVAPLLFGLVMMRPLNKAIEVQDQLAAEMGARDAFSPPAGVVAPERLEAFLAVRQAVMPMCPKFTKFAEDLARMDDLGKQSDQPDKGEVFRALTRVSGSVVGMAGRHRPAEPAPQRGPAGPSHGAGRIHLAVRTRLSFLARQPGARHRRRG